MLEIAFSGQLWLPQVETTVSEVGLNFAESGNDSWVLPGVPDGYEEIHLDLEQVTYVHIAALAYLVIILQAASAARAVIDITLPRDAGALDFIASSRFVEALQDSERSDLRVTCDRQIPERTSYRRLVALSWIDPGDDVPPPTLWLREVLRAANASGESLTDTEADALSRIIIRELCENVHQHSGRDRALVAIWAQRDNQPVSSRRFLGGELRSFAAMHAATLSAVEVVVADAGVGIRRSLYGHTASLDGQELLAHAFNRWSSRIDQTVSRGTRGLYMVSRIAAQRLGMTTLRTGRLIAVSSAATQADSDQPQAGTTDQGFPGTFIRVHLPLSLRTPPILIRSRGYTEDIRTVTPTAADFRDLERVRRILVYGRKADQFTLLNATNFPSRDEGDIAEMLISVCDVAHPVRVAVYGLRVSDAALKRIALVVTARVDQICANDPDSIYHFEPVLLVGGNILASSWIGTVSRIVGALSADQIELAQDVSLILGFSNIRRDSNGSWALRLTPQALLDSLSRDFEAQLQRSLVVPPVGRYLLPPSLSPVDGWVDIDAIFTGRRVKRDIIARILVSRLAERVPTLGLGDVGVLFESSVDRAFAMHVAEAMSAPDEHASVSREDFDAGRPINLVTRRIVVVVNAVTSGQSARRLVGFAMRQGYEVLAVLAIVDNRTVGEDLSLWGRSFPICTISHFPRQAALPTSRTPEYLENPDEVSLTSAVLRTQKVLRRLDRAGAVKLGHFAGSRSRHFTFLIDPERSLNDPTLHTWLVGATRDVLQSTVSLAASEHRRVLLVAENEERLDQPALRFAVASSQSLWPLAPVYKEEFISTHEIDDRTTVAHFVWEAFTGANARRALRRYAKMGVTHLVIVCVLSGMDPEEEESLRSIAAYVTPGGGEMRVRFEVLAHVPIASFRPNVCPVCAQVPRAHVAPASDLVPEQVKSARRRRTLVRPDDVPAGQDQVGYVHGTAEVGLVGQALIRRSDLVGAGRSVARAEEVRRIWTSRLIEDGASRRRFALSLSTLLIFEPTWLTRVPLSDEKLRTQLTNTVYECIVDVIDGQGAQTAREATRRFLLALRLLSKNVFISRLPELEIACRSDSELFEQLIYLTETIIDKDYLRRTGLPTRLAAALVAMQSQMVIAGCDAVSLSRVDQLIARNAVTAKRTLASQQGTLDLLRECSSYATEIAKHDSIMEFEASARVDSIGAVRESYLAWQRLVRVVKSDAESYVREARDWLRQTVAIEEVESEFNAVFPSAGPGVLEEAAALLGLAMAEKRPLTHAEAERYREIRDIVQAVLGRPNRPNGEPPRDTALQRASLDCRVRVSTLYHRLKSMNRQLGLDIIVVPPEESMSAVDLPLPSLYVRLLCNTLLKNTDRCRIAGSGEPTTIKIAVEESVSDGRLLKAIHFISTNVRSSPRDAQSSTKGHLRELREDRALRGVTLRTSENPDAGVFVISLLIRDER